jgi:fructose-1,6-bisphosphatase II
LEEKMSEEQKAPVTEVKKAKKEKQEQLMNRNLELDLARVTENAAIGSAKWMGRGDKNSADQAAVTGMRNMFDTVNIDGVVVIGEGEKDEAPMLYIGEQIGKGGEHAMAVDIAVDPLDGTTSTAKGRANAVSVIALAPRGRLFATKNYYMEKMAVGPKAKGAIDLNRPLAENLLNVAEALNKNIEDLTVTILERDRHKDIIDQCRKLGCRIKMFSDGDVGAAIATCFSESGIDVLVGIGGCPEGVLAAAALKCLGGEIQGRLYAHTSEEIKKAQADPNYYDILTTDDLASGDDILFIATGVTDGDMLKGVRFMPNNKVLTETVVMRSASGTIRFIKAIHDMNKKPGYGRITEK